MAGQFVSNRQQWSTNANPSMSGSLLCIDSQHEAGVEASEDTTDIDYLFVPSFHSPDKDREMLVSKEQVEESRLFSLLLLPSPPKSPLCSACRRNYFDRCRNSILGLSVGLKETKIVRKTIEKSISGAGASFEEMGSIAEKTAILEEQIVEAKLEEKKKHDKWAAMHERRLQLEEKLAELAIMEKTHRSEYNDVLSETNALAGLLSLSVSRCDEISKSIVRLNGTSIWHQLCDIDVKNPYRPLLNGIPCPAVMSQPLQQQSSSGDVIRPVFDWPSTNAGLGQIALIVRMLLDHTGLAYPVDAVIPLGMQSSVVIGGASYPLYGPPASSWFGRQRPLDVALQGILSCCAALQTFLLHSQNISLRIDGLYMYSEGDMGTHSLNYRADWAWVASVGKLLSIIHTLLRAMEERWNRTRAK
jgi:hypothetical protein